MFAPLLALLLAAPSGDLAAPDLRPSPGAEAHDVRRGEGPGSQPLPSEGEPPAAPEPPALPAAAPAVPVPVKPPEVPALANRVAVLGFDANAAALADAPAVAQLVTAKLEATPGLLPGPGRARLTAEEIHALLPTGACEVTACWDALIAASDARFVVTGRVDRFGRRYLLHFNLLDLSERELVVHPRGEAVREDTLLRTADELAEQLSGTLADRVAGRRVSRFGPVLGLRINNSFIRNLASLNPGAELELGFRFHPEWVGFLQVGFTVVRSDQAGSTGGLNVVPSVLGARHLYRVERALRPYWGFGLGVQLSFGPYGIFQKTGSLPNVVGFAGMEFIFAKHLALQLEAGTNIAQATLGLAGEEGLGRGLNLDVNAGIAYYF